MTLLLAILVTLLSDARCTSLHVRPAKIVSSVTYASSGTVTTTRGTLPPLTTTGGNTTLPTTPTNQPLIDPRNQVPLRMGDSENEDSLPDRSDGSVEFPREKRQACNRATQSPQTVPNNVTVPRPVNGSLIDPRIQGSQRIGDSENEEDFPEREEDRQVSRKKRQATTCGCYTPSLCPSIPSAESDQTDIRSTSGGESRCGTGLTYCCPSSNPGRAAFRKSKHQRHRRNAVIAKFLKRNEKSLTRYGKTNLAHENLSHSRKKRQVIVCGCYPPTQCAASSVNGSAVIDFNATIAGTSQCDSASVYCCTSRPCQASFTKSKQKSKLGAYPKKGDGVNLKSKVEFTEIPRDKRQTACGCYPPAQCNSTNNTDGSGLIDFRIVSGGTPTCATGLTFCCPSTNSAQISCGARFTPTASVTLTPGQARYGDFPWMVLIQNSTDGAYIGGGVLIDTNNVLTTAHRIIRFINGTGLRIRLGEYDQNVTTEQYPYRDFTVGRFWVHESFNPGTLQNDVALIRLSASVTINPASGIVPICMPTTGQSFEGQRCWVAGWGVDSFVNGRLQAALRAADVPIIAQAACETSLRSTRLGNAWSLDRSSFVCAGGEANKDACTGDGGSGLVCEVTTGRWVLAGLVAWGIGCASQGVPAAYVNVVNYLPWIQTRLSQ